MASWITYKGLDLPDNPTGDAGMYLKSDLQALADRVGPCNFTATANPLPGNDITQGYQIGSLWLNTAAGSWWVCTNNSAGYANWLLLAPSLSQATVVATSALPANNYSNGSGGVGATLTATGVGVLTVDGHSVAFNETVLVTDEATDANNGLYVCTRAGASGTTYVLTRSAMMNLPSQFVGAIIPVGPVGTSDANTLWQCQVTGAPTIGTTSIQFAQISPPLSLPINLPNADSPVFSVDADGNMTCQSITSDGGAISSNGTGVLTVGGLSGGGYVSADTIQAGGDGLSSEGGLIVYGGNATLDGGTIYTDGEGNLTVESQLVATTLIVEGETLLDASVISTDGHGNMTIGSDYLNGSLTLGSGSGLVIEGAPFLCQSSEINFENLPTSDPGVFGNLWMDPSAGYAIKVSQG